MYEVYKQIWNNGKSLLQFVASYPTLDSAHIIAKRVKGIVKVNGTTCLDLR